MAKTKQIDWTGVAIEAALLIFALRALIFIIGID